MLWLGQPARFGHRWSASPSARTSGVAHEGQVLRHLPLARILRAQRRNRPDHLGDHVAGAANDHGVALAHVLAPHLVLVVQRRRRDRDAADEHRLEERERGDLPGAPGMHADLAKDRRALLGRELVGDRPAGRVARRAELLLQRDRVDLHHDAVDLPVDRVALLFPLHRVGLDLLDRVGEVGGGLHRQTCAPAPLEEPGL